MLPSTALRYLLNELDFDIASLSSHSHTPFWHRLRWWLRHRQNKAPYWSDRAIANSAIYCIKGYRDKLKQIEKDISV